MCEPLIAGEVCWLVVLWLAAIPAGICLFIAVRVKVRRHRALALGGLPFARIASGAVRLAGVLRAEGGSCYLEEPSTGRRGLLLGVAWPSYFHWCHCVWP